MPPPWSLTWLRASLPCSHHCCWLQLCALRCVYLLVRAVGGHWKALSYPIGGVCLAWWSALRTHTSLRLSCKAHMPRGVTWRLAAQAGGGREPAAGALPAGVPADILLHAQRGALLPPAQQRGRAPLERAGRLAPARIQRAAALSAPQVTNLLLFVVPSGDCALGL